MNGTRRIRTIVQDVRRNLPDPLTRAARSGAIGWGWLTSPLRMTPALLVVGAQRCGTTTMFRVLADHPDVRRPTVSKGVGYFDEQYVGHDQRWYTAHFPIRWPTGRADGERAPITFDSSGYTCFHPLAPARIAADLPEAKVLMMVRDPVERAFSAFKHETARGFETETFDRALELEPERLAGEVEKLRADPSYASFSHRHHGYLARGRYAEQVGRLRKELGAERVYVMDADHFFARPAQEFAAFAEWLGLSSWAPDDVRQWNARPSTPMDPTIRARLLEHFEPHDAELAALTGSTPSWRE